MFVKLFTCGYSYVGKSSIIYLRRWICCVVFCWGFFVVFCRPSRSRSHAKRTGDRSGSES